MECLQLEIHHARGVEASPGPRTLSAQGKPCEQAVPAPRKQGTWGEPGKQVVRQRGFNWPQSPECINKCAAAVWWFFFSHQERKFQLTSSFWILILVSISSCSTVLPPYPLSILRAALDVTLFNYPKFRAGRTFSKKKEEPCLCPTKSSKMSHLSIPCSPPFTFILLVSTVFNEMFGMLALYQQNYETHYHSAA